jgi:hypothetical protein
MNKPKKIRRSFLFLLIFAFVFCLTECSSTNQKKQFSGYFIANDCGQSHGGFEWAGEYTASLEISGNKGHLTLTFSAGLGDPLTEHQFAVSGFAEVGGNMSFKIEGTSALLGLDENDTIWDGRFNNYYSANKSLDSSEQMGALPVEVFSGFQPHYYVELRLKP